MITHNLTENGLFIASGFAIFNLSSSPLWYEVDFEILSSNQIDNPVYVSLPTVEQDEGTVSYIKFINDNAFYKHNHGSTDDVLLLRQKDSIHFGRVLTLSLKNRFKKESDFLHHLEKLKSSTIRYTITFYKSNVIFRTNELKQHKTHTEDIELKFLINEYLQSLD